MLIQLNQPDPRARMFGRQFFRNSPFHLKIARGILVGKKALTLFCLLILLTPLLFLPFVEVASANFNHYSAPKMTVLSPLTNVVYSQSSISLSVKVEMRNWDMSDWEQLAELKYSLDGQPDVSATIENEVKTAGVDGLATATISGLADGAHSLYIHGQTTFSKYASLSANFSSTIYFVVNSVTPTIQIVSPQQTTYNSITAPLEYTSNKPLTWAGYSLDQNMVVDCLDNATLTNLSNGVHSLRVYGTDSAGKVYASKQISFSVNGKEPPVVTIDVEAIINARKYLPSDFQDKTWWRLIFNVNEPTSWIAYSMDGGANQTIDGDTNIRMSYGSHTVIVYAKDLCGNAGASAPYTFVLVSGEAGSAYASPTDPPPTSHINATTEPSQSNTLNQQAQPDWYQMTLIAASAALVAIVASICVFLFKRNHRRKDDV